ncbi:MAG: hypothetical protein ABIU54_01555 [Candidatus Eisenbacteria bacterium]
MLARTLPHPRAAQPAPLWTLALFVCAVALFWHDTLVTHLALSPALAPRHVQPRLAAAGGVFTQLLFSAFEAFLYARLWRATGRRLPWLRTAAALFVISSFEAFALFVLQRPDAPSFTWLVGARAAWPNAIATTGLDRALGAVGLLALLRIALTAHVQARGTGARYGHAMAMTLAGWLGSRLVLWWTADLLRGRSYGL